MKNCILDKIIIKGGLIGASANLCKGNDELTDKFIQECFEQRNTILAKEEWGNELIKLIVSYTKKMKK